MSGYDRWLQDFDHLISYPPFPPGIKIPIYKPSSAKSLIALYGIIVFNIARLKLCSPAGERLRVFEQQWK